MNVLDFVVAVLILQPLIIGLGLVGYWLRPRHPRAGLVLGVAAVAMVLIGVFVSLWQYIAAAIAGAVVGAGAIVRPSSPSIARWLVTGGAVAWVAALVLLFVDAAG